MQKSVTIQKKQAEDHLSGEIFNVSDAVPGTLH